jgi:hypothetical protein
MLWGDIAEAPLPGLTEPPGDRRTPLDDRVRGELGLAHMKDAAGRAGLDQRAEGVFICLPQAQDLPPTAASP